MYRPSGLQASPPSSSLPFSSLRIFRSEVQPLSWGMILLPVALFSGCPSQRRASEKLSPSVSHTIVPFLNPSPACRMEKTDTCLQQHFYAEELLRISQSSESVRYTTSTSTSDFCFSPCLLKCHLLFPP